MRSASITRKTKETDISLALNIEASGKADIKTDCGFFKHMLELFASHGRFDIKMDIKGDSFVDYHHSVEDSGIVLGEAFLKALGDKKGIARYGWIILAMDEALIMVSVDISGRAYTRIEVDIPNEKVGDFDTELVSEFFYAFCRASGITLHIQQLSGENSHHIIEGIFKAFARALRQAVALDKAYEGEIPSTKGAI